jgi:hypothetical protein
MTRPDVVIVCSAALATLLAVVVGADAFSTHTKVAYDEIDVRRINVREEDGTLRIVVSNKARFPEIIFRGKEHPHPNRDTAGVLFYNEEETEAGGLTFSGRKANGKVASGGHLAFDRYEQDQEIQITHDQQDGRRWAGFAVNEYPEGSTDLDAWDRAKAMPEGADKTAELQRLRERYGGKRRVFLGKQQDRSSRLVLNDAAGRPRMVLEVGADGAAAVRFLDESGKVLRTITPSSAIHAP